MIRIHRILPKALSQQFRLAVLTLSLFLTLCLAYRPLPASASELGDPAPALAVSAWIQGDPLDLEALQNKVVVVEFWATWCAPCRISIPHLNKLQKTHKDRLVIIGISDESPSTVKRFVDRMGDEMTYTVASDEERKTYDAYMEAYDQQGIPTAFVVNPERQVIWVGHPMDGLDAVIEEVLEGRFDLEQARQHQEADRVRQAKQEQLQSLFQTYALALEQEDPQRIQSAQEALQKAVEGDLENLNTLAWVLFVSTQLPNRDLTFGMELAKQAVELSEGKNADVLDTYARGLQVTGKLKEAIQYQQRAVELADSSELRSELQSTLDEYRKELQKAEQSSDSPDKSR